MLRSTVLPMVIIGEVWLAQVKSGLGYFTTGYARYARLGNGFKRFF